MSKILHIVAFDVPAPPNYGGVIDVFYKIKNLHQLGIKIILHCFDYGRGEQAELQKYCTQVYYYKRDTSKKLFFNKLPFIVVSRRSEKLLKNLCQDNAPILFEGIHCCYYLNNDKLKGRKKIVRMHNIEHDYYRQLASVERTVFRRIYFSNEAKKLEKFQKNISVSDAVLAISPSDLEALNQINVNKKNNHYIPAFHAYNQVAISLTAEKFCLFHGNLAVGENNQAALFLVNEVFAGLSIPLVIAGSKPSKELKEAVQKSKNVQLKADISTDEINNLIQKAQINILPTHQATGIKLKLLAALFTGKHCLVNTPMVLNTGLENLCTVAKTPAEFKARINELIHVPFKEQDIQKREDVLRSFSPELSAKKLIDIIF